LAGKQGLQTFLTGFSTVWLKVIIIMSQPFEIPPIQRDEEE
jgi:hypothetical protein